MEKLDLHYYDNKIPHNEKIDSEIKDASTIDAEEKILMFKRLREILASKDTSSLHCYDIIIADFIKSGRGGSNHDTSNNLYACDLMYLCYKEIVLNDNKVMLNELILQLIDMNTGMCNPGRTTRLYQVVNAFM